MGSVNKSYITHSLFLQHNEFILTKSWKQYIREGEYTSAYYF